VHVTDIRRRLRGLTSLLIFVASVVTFSLSGLGAGSLGASAASSPTTVDIYATYYGWYDNTPPGCATAYSGCAGGIGTYTSPITFASDTQEFPVGTILYYPTVEKYFVMGDSCQECTEDWQGHGPDGGPVLHHVDLWIGGEAGNEFDAINCEDALTQGLPDGAPLLTPFIENPPANEPVSQQPLFNAKTNQCFGGATTSTIVGRYRNNANHDCLAAPSSSRALNAGATTEKCRAVKNEDVAFDGAFLIVNGRCLQINGKGIGSYLDFASCDGGPRQQWEINPSGTITWIQYSACVSQVAARVKLTKCSNSAAERWTFVAERST
jgi:Ricin-type beta-trefoil lectin domain